MSEHLPIGERHYRILELLGRGGNGSVYRAELRGAQGFRKDVAVKLLTATDPSDAILGRFRDEARLLGLLRDRAIVSVDPPTRLDGRWAVVMEFVDGCSLSRLLRTTGPLPPEIALQIVAEVARALGKAWSHPGPDGEPLHLLHRDIKPANLQLTPSGEVKLLDFGIAKSTGAPREAVTETTELHGTAGYVAPERFVGQEVESTDVFSLGVVLWNLLTGNPPDPDVLGPTPVLPDDAPLDDAARHLARRMMQGAPSMRPTPREVEREAKALARSGALELQEWAETHVPTTSHLEPDQLVGMVLNDTVPTVPASTATLAATVVLAGGTSLLVAAGLAGVALVLVILAFSWGGSVPPSPGLAPVAPAATEPAPPAPVSTPVAPAAPPAPSPDPRVAPSPVPHPAPAPHPTAAPDPTPRVAPSPTPGPAEPWQAHTFGSSPPGATVRVDGHDLGVTPITSPVVLTPGRHQLEMVLDGQTLQATFTVSSLTKRNHVCRLAERACF